MKRPFRQVVAALVSLLMLCLPAMAAEENIFSYLRETLQDEVASITLYNPTESFSPYGELMFNERDGFLELEISAEDSSELTEAVRVDPADVAEPTPAPESEEDEENGEDEEEDASESGQTTSQPVVPEGYVLVRVTTKARDAVLLCMKAEYAESPAQRAREKAEEEAAQNESSEEPEADSEPEQTSPMPLIMPEPEEQLTSTRTGRLSGNEILLLIAALVILMIAVAELAVILSLRSRAENVAKNYIRMRAALDKSKRELTAAKSRNVVLERELLQEKNKMHAIKQQFERMGGKAPKADIPAEDPQKVEPAPARKADNEKNLPDLDYLRWTL